MHDRPDQHRPGLHGVVAYPDAVAARYRRAGYWRGETFGALLRTLADRHGDRVAVVDGDRRIGYAELDRRVDRLAAGLTGIGITRGDRVVVQLPNVAAFVEVVFALFRVGALPVYSLPAHRRSEVTYLCRHSDAVALVTVATHDGFDHLRLAREVAGAAPSVRHVLLAGDDPGEGGLTDSAGGRAVAVRTLDEVAEPLDRPPPASAAEPSDVAFLQLSGGTTGLPKLIPRTHDDYLYSVRASAEICRLDTGAAYLAVLPVAHNFPMSSPGFLGVLHAGGTVVLAPSGSPDVAFGLVERERITITALVPPLAMVWLDAAATTPHDLSSLRVLQVGGAKFGEAAARRVRPTLGCTLQQVFGMAEGLVNYTRLDDPEDVIVTTQGRPISPDDEILVTDDDDRPVPRGQRGHLLTRGPYTIRGYYRAPEHDQDAFTPDGWYRTGDIVRQAPTGHLVVEGRAKEQINRGGDKIAAEEIENHLLAHPDVRDAAVVSVPDDYLGERVCAFVIRRPARTVTARDLRSFLYRRGIAAYKIPDKFAFVDDLPHTGVGKTSKRTLRRTLATPDPTGRAAP